ncbi:MAG: hypothetical protein WD638_03535 [Nitriliruptoraceae bacterium]
MTAPHLPYDASLPPVLRGVEPLGIDLGSSDGQRVLLLSLERWDGWADLRFARVDVGATRRLTRRVPPAEAWSVTSDGVALEIFDAVGRGDRLFSNGEVRLVPAPEPGSTLDIQVTVVPDTPPLTGQVTLSSP